MTADQQFAAGDARVHDMVLASAGGMDGIAVHKAVIDEQLIDGGVGRRVVVVGGAWLSEAYSVGYAGELADKRARVKYLEAHAADVPYNWLVGAAAAGIVLGAAAGFCAGQPGHCGLVH